MTEDLVDFIRARLLERRAIAEAAQAVDPGPWTADVNDDSGTAQRHGHGAGLLVAADGVALWDCEGADVLCMTAPSARHAALHHPLNAIADIDAKLAVLDHYARLRHYAEVEGREPYILAEGAASVILKLLAQPFAGHPKYKEEWRP